MLNKYGQKYMQLFKVISVLTVVLVSNMAIASNTQVKKQSAGMDCKNIISKATAELNKSSFDFKDSWHTDKHGVRKFYSFATKSEKLSTINMTFEAFIDNSGKCVASYIKSTIWKSPCYYINKAVFGNSNNRSSSLNKTIILTNRKNNKKTTLTPHNEATECLSTEHGYFYD